MGRIILQRQITHAGMAQTMNTTHARVSIPRLTSKYSSVIVIALLLRHLHDEGNARIPIQWWYDNADVKKSAVCCTCAVQIHRPVRTPCTMHCN